MLMMDKTTSNILFTTINTKGIHHEHGKKTRG
jgi:hypothetical protein